MKILLINPPLADKEKYGNSLAFIQKYEPLGLLYIAAVAEQKGYDVSVIDALAQNLDIETLKERIKDINPAILGITTLTSTGASVFELGKWVKEYLPKILVILGNVHASVFAKEYLENNCCDVVVHGEGEEVFIKIVERHLNKSGFIDIPGIVYKTSSGEISENKGYNVINDLAFLPFPARSLVETNLYGLNNISNQLYVNSRKQAAKTLITSRGCPNRCRFCVVHNNQKPRFNSAKMVVDEIECLIKTYGTEYFYIEDSLFIADKQRLLEICDEIVKRKLKIKWGAQAHINYILQEMLKPMEDAGCYDLGIGIESGVQRVLNLIRKNINLKQVAEKINIIKKYSNIKIDGLFMLGNPSETYEEALETIEFAKSLDIDLAQFSIFTPYPGSPIFEELKSKNEIDTGLRGNGSLDTSVWSRYFAYPSLADIDPIWVTPTMTKKQLIALQKKAQREFYLRPKIILKNLKRLKFDNIYKLIKIAVKGFF